MSKKKPGYQEPPQEGDVKIRHQIKPRSENQKKLFEALNKSTIVVGVGPAGTGKTFISVVHGLKLLNDRAVDRIIITRPVVDNDEELGFLPGTVDEKMAPWVRPIMDSIVEMIGGRSAKKLFEDGTIEICPLSFMRGRTFKRAFIIADEMSNSTPSQMRNLLTRIGEGSRMSILGDPSQSDLKDNKNNGLSDFLTAYGKYNKETGGLSVVNLSIDDIVRHQLIPMILDIYGVADDSSLSKMDIGIDIDYDNIGKAPLFSNK